MKLRAFFAVFCAATALGVLSACDTPRDYECKAIWTQGHEVAQLKVTRLKELRSFEYAMELCESRAKSQEPAQGWDKFECQCALPSD